MSLFRDTIRVFIDRELSPEAMSARLAETAKKALADLQASGRAPTVYRRFIDGGNEGAAEETARRQVYYEFSSLADAVSYAIERLQAHAPVESGAYRDGFMVAVDGRPVPARGYVARSVPPGATVFLYNREPYSRKVDTQRIGTRPILYHTAPGMFDAVAKEVRGRFGNSVKVERLYTVNIPGAYRLKTGAKRGKQVESPALQITAVS